MQLNADPFGGMNSVQHRAWWSVVVALVGVLAAASLATNAYSLFSPASPAVGWEFRILGFAYGIAGISACFASFRRSSRTRLLAGAWLGCAVVFTLAFVPVLFSKTPLAAILPTALALLIYYGAYRVLALNAHAA